MKWTIYHPTVQVVWKEVVVCLMTGYIKAISRITEFVVSFFFAAKRMLCVTHACNVVQFLGSFRQLSLMSFMINTAHQQSIQKS